MIRIECIKSQCILPGIHMVWRGLLCIHIVDDNLRILCTTGPSPHIIFALGDIVVRRSGDEIPCAVIHISDYEICTKYYDYVHTKNYLCKVPKTIQYMLGGLITTNEYKRAYLYLRYLYLLNDIPIEVVKYSMLLMLEYVRLDTSRYDIV